MNGAEIVEFAPKVGVKTSEDVWQKPTAKKLWAHREKFADAIREYNARRTPLRNWTLQFVIRHSAYHMLDHAWEMEDRDLTGES